MSTRPLTITFTAPQGGGSAEPVDLLLLEQPPWPERIGQATKVAVVNWLAGTLFDDESILQMDCGFSGGRTGADIWAWPLRADVSYRIATTHGELGEGEWEEVDEEAVLQYTLADTADLPHPAMSLVDIEWLAAYDASGNPDAEPGVSVDPWSRSVRLTAPTYGSVRVRYRTGRWVHRLSVPRREDAIENWYSAWIVAYPSGGRPVFLEFDPPPAAESGGDIDCGRHTTGSITADDDDELEKPEANRSIRTMTYDYCTGLLVNDNTVSV